MALFYLPHISFIFYYWFHLIFHLTFLKHKYAKSLNNNFVFLCGKSIVNVFSTFAVLNICKTIFLHKIIEFYHFSKFSSFSIKTNLTKIEQDLDPIFSSVKLPIWCVSLGKFYNILLQSSNKNCACAPFLSPTVFSFKQLNPI